MSITIYVRDGCGKCEKLKATLTAMAVDFFEKNIDRYRDVLLKKYPQIDGQSLPLIFVGETLLKNEIELMKYLKENNGK